MAGGEPRLGTTATYMRHNDHGATHLSTKIDRLHDRLDNEYEVFSAGSVKKWSKFGLEKGLKESHGKLVDIAAMEASKFLTAVREWTEEQGFTPVKLSLPTSSDRATAVK